MTRGRAFAGVQAAVVVVFLTAYLLLPSDARARFDRHVLGQKPIPQVAVPREQALALAPLYDDAQVVSDEQLRRVLDHLQPRLRRQQLRPNHVEHALRTWGARAKFKDPDALSGIELRDVLVDHGKYLASWRGRVEPLLIDQPEGVAIRWSSQPDSSTHHDHWLASLSEAGVPIDQPIYAPARRDMTLNDALQEALRDFDLDEREVEWSAMAFGYWLAPQKSWQNAEGRTITFDLLARRLMRSRLGLGVCSGTHFVYSLVVLLRLDDEHDVLSDDVRAEVMAHLARVRDSLIASQYNDGRWPSNWQDGAAAREKPEDVPIHKQVIATGHHLEWLALAPEELHPPREDIRRAAMWLINTTLKTPREDIRKQYTYFSHVAVALSLWRHTTPSSTLSGLSGR